MQRNGYATLSCYLLALATFLLDQYSKLAVVATIALGNSLPLIDGTFHLTHVRNLGSAFSLFWGKGTMLSLAGALIVLGLVYYQWRAGTDHPLLTLGMGLVLGGALGNLADRLFLGYVRDFFDLRWHGINIWPIFNVADMAVLAGMGLILLYLSHQEKKSTEAA